jgi:hypothetical protein
MLAFALVLLSAVHPLLGSTPPQLDFFQRDGHSHHHSKPLLELNETDILLWHSPTPPSYGGVDFEAADSSLPSRSGLIIFHVAMMCLAYFVALPIGKTSSAFQHSSYACALCSYRDALCRALLACTRRSRVLHPNCPRLRIRGYLCQADARYVNTHQLPNRSCAD